MSLPLEGRRVALAETRQLAELEAMLAKEGATPVPCPLVSILDADDPAPVRGWLADLIADRFGYVVFMTGEGVRRLTDRATGDGLRAAFLAALGRARLVSRGPKPVKALKEIGLTPGLVAAAPTSEGVIETLRKESLHGIGVGVQFHGDVNEQLLAFLDQAGATVGVVQPYRYAPASDADRVAALIEEMAAGTLDLLIFTSSPQVQRLHDVAAERGLVDRLRAGLEKTCVAAVGPIAADAARERGWRVDIVPEQGFVMKNLVQYIKRELDQKQPRT